MSSVSCIGPGLRQHLSENSENVVGYDSQRTGRYFARLSFLRALRHMPLVLVVFKGERLMTMRARSCRQRYVIILILFIRIKECQINWASISFGFSGRSSLRIAMGSKRFSPLSCGDCQYMSVSQ